MQLWRRATRSTSLGSVSCRRISCTILNATGATMPGSSGRRASAIRIRNSRSRRRALISVAVFLRGNSPKYSSMYWIASGYVLIRYSIKIRSIVPQVGAQPALHLLDANTLSCRVVFDLVSADAADGEVPGLGVCEIEAAHRRGRGHGRAFGQ